MLKLMLASCLITFSSSMLWASDDEKPEDRQFRRAEILALQLEQQIRANKTPIESAYIAGIEVQGLRWHSKEDVLRLIRMRVGRFYDPDVWNEDQCRLLENNTFTNVRMLAPVKTRDGVQLTITLVENP